MRMQRKNKYEKAYQKIKSLQRWLNKHFPEELPQQPMDDYKFIEAEDFLAEEARIWHQSKANKT